MEISRMKQAETHFSYQVSDLNISIKDIEEIAHIGEGMPSYADFLDQELSLLQNNATIQGGYVIVDGSVETENIVLEKTVFKVGKQITPFFRKMSHGAVFVCTAGPEITQRAKELNDQGELVEGYLVDVLGSVMVEKAMDKIQEALKENVKALGLKITNRYSPGYCDWNVNEQKMLFSFLPQEFCDISLSESCLMHPTKSVSGIIGVGEHVKFHKHVCHACSSVNCLYRNTTR